MCKQLRWQEGPLPPTTTTTPFSCFPGRVLLGGDSVSASHLHAIFYSITCCALPTSASKAPELIVKPLCDLIRLISFECGDNRCCLSPIRCHLFFWTHNLPETAVVTSVSENSQRVQCWLWAAVIPWGLSFKPKSESSWPHHPRRSLSFLPEPGSLHSPLTFHPVPKCTLLDNFQWLLIVSIITEKGSCLTFTDLLILLQAVFQPHLQPLRAAESTPPDLKCWQCFPSPFPYTEVPTPPQDSAQRLNLFRTAFMSSLLIPHPGQDFSSCCDSMHNRGCASVTALVAFRALESPMLSSDFLY